MELNSEWKVTGIERHEQLNIRLMEEFFKRRTVLVGTVDSSNKKLMVLSKDLLSVVESNPSLLRVAEDGRDLDKIRKKCLFYFDLMFLTKVDDRRRLQVVTGKRVEA